MNGEAKKFFERAVDVCCVLYIYEWKVVQQEQSGCILFYYCFIVRNTFCFHWKHWTFWSFTTLDTDLDTEHIYVQ